MECFAMLYYVRYEFKRAGVRKDWTVRIAHHAKKSHGVGIHRTGPGTFQYPNT